MSLFQFVSILCVIVTAIACRAKGNNFKYCFKPDGEVN